MLTSVTHPACSPNYQERRLRERQEAILGQRDAAIARRERALGETVQGEDEGLERGRRAMRRTEEAEARMMSEVPQGQTVMGRSLQHHSRSLQLWGRVE